MQLASYPNVQNYAHKHPIILTKMGAYYSPNYTITLDSSLILSVSHLTS